MFHIPHDALLASGQYIEVFLRIMLEMGKLGGMYRTQELCSMSNCIVGPVQGGSLCFSWNHLGTGRIS